MSVRNTVVSMATAGLAAGVLAGCSPASADNGRNAASGTLRLGYFPNVTHAVPVIGVENGTYAKELGKTQLKTQTFNAGPAAVQALLAGAIDAVYLGPNPAINAYEKSSGAVRLVAGGASGGAALVVKPGITSAQQLIGTSVASPQLGGTQDVALRYFLKNKGINFGGGNNGVAIVAQDNAQTLDAFKQGRIAGAWLPEPWVSRLVAQGGAKVLVNEASLWPEGRFTTTNLLVSTAYLKKNPQTIKALLTAQVATAEAINANKAAAASTLDTALKKLTGKSLPAGVAATALANVTVGWDPYAASLATEADHAVAVGLLKEPDLHGIYDLTLLNEVLKADGKPAVSAAGLDASGS